MAMAIRTALGQSDSRVNHTAFYVRIRGSIKVGDAGRLYPTFGVATGSTEANFLTGGTFRVEVVQPHG